MEVVADGDGHGLAGDVTRGRRGDGNLADIEGKRAVARMKADIGDFVPGAVGAAHGRFEFVKDGEGCGLIEDGVKAVVAGQSDFLEEILRSGAERLDWWTKRMAGCAVESTGMEREPKMRT